MDGLLERSRALWDGADVVAVDDARRERMLRINERWTHDGLRVLGVAVRQLGAGEAPTERNLLFVGLIGTCSLGVSGLVLISIEGVKAWWRSR